MSARADEPGSPPAVVEDAAAAGDEADGAGDDVDLDALEKVPSLVVPCSVVPLYRRAGAQCLTLDLCVCPRILWTVGQTHDQISTKEIGKITCHG